MEVEYRKDLRHNYMVIAECEDSSIEPYCIKLLEHQTIAGLLSMEQKQMDNKSLYYYDITAKQSMINLLDKTVLSCDKVKQLFARILDTMERAYEYLLPEDDFILSPEYIYLDVTSNIPFLCFFSGYHKSIKEQMNLLIEYLMNKVDYNDKDAVLLVYQLYAVSREEGFTFEHLSEALKKQIQTPLENRSHHKDIICSENMLGGDYQREEDKKRENKPIPLMIKHENLINKDNKMSVMMEKIEGEEETSCYPMKTYLYTGVCIAGGIFITLLGFSTGILYNTFGNRVDYSKLFALVLMIFCVDGYLVKKLWDKKNKITKMIAKQEYIDPRLQNINQEATIEREAITEEREKVLIRRSNDNVSHLNKEHHSAPMQQKINVHTMRADIIYSEEINKQEEDNPTCLLNESFEKTGLILKSLQEANYQTIHLTDFPFFIGKLKENVDYCLEKDVVSRFHAKITKEQEQYYITDLNSKNGTFVNQENLQTYQKKEIKLGDEIAFANIKYLFMLQ